MFYFVMIYDILFEQDERNSDKTLQDLYRNNIVWWQKRPMVRRILKSLPIIKMYRKLIK
jgi:hypothetical protein